MLRTPRRIRLGILFGFAALLAGSGVAQANACEWTLAGTGDFTTAANWSSCGGTFPQPADTIVLSVAGGGTITMDASATVAGISQSSTAGAHTIAGANTLTIGASGITLGAITDVTISAPVSAGTLTVTGSSTGKVIFTNTTNAFTSLVVTGASTGGPEFGASGTLGSGTITLSGGSLHFNSTSSVDYTNGATRTVAITVTATGTINLNNTTGTVTHKVSSVTIDAGQTLKMVAVTNVSPALETASLDVQGTLEFSLASYAGLWVRSSFTEGASAAYTMFGHASISPTQSGLRFFTNATVTKPVEGRGVSARAGMIAAEGSVVDVTSALNMVDASNNGGRLTLVARGGGFLTMSGSLSHRRDNSSQSLHLRGDAGNGSKIKFATTFDIVTGTKVQGLRVRDGIIWETTHSNNYPNWLTFSQGGVQSTWLVTTNAQTYNAGQNDGLQVTDPLAIQTDQNLTINTQLTSTGTITKTGSGTLTLASSTSVTGRWSGTLNVNAGALSVTGALLATTMTNVASGATIGGTGTAGDVTIANGGNLAPGSGGVGTLAVDVLTLNDTSNLNFELGAPSTGDQVTATGTLTLDGVLNITNAGGMAAGTYTLMTYAGALTNNTVTVGTAPAGFSYVLSASAGSVILTVATVTAVRGLQASASRRGQVTRLRWTTAGELDNLGFDVYRQERGRSVRLNDAPIAGSALVAGPGVPLAAGRSYAWTDLTTATSPRYWIESIDLSGHRERHGPVVPQRAPSPDGAAVSALLSEVGVEDARPSVDLPRPPSPALAAVGWGRARQAALQIRVRGDGLFRVRGRDLIAAGLPAGADGRRMRLEADGVEVPFELAGGEDGRVDPDDRLGFFGFTADTPFTSTRTYWLSAGTAPSRRFGAGGAARDGGAPAGTWPHTIVDRPRTIYFAALRNGEAENFFGPIVSTMPAKRTLVVEGLGAGPVTLSVALQGVSDNAHAVGVTVNGTEIGVLRFAGRARGAATLEVPAGLVRAGTNELSLLAGRDDTTVIDVVHLTYPRLYATAGDSPSVLVTGGKPVTLGALPAGARLFDVTDPLDVAELSVPTTRGSDALTITASGIGARTLVPVLASQDLGPGELRAKGPRDWSSFAGADLVIIGPRVFLPSLEPLRAQRMREGLTVALIDVDDIYDEWSYGAKSPVALREFLTRTAQAWPRRARYALLVGDATSDPRDRLGRGAFDLVPTKLIDTSLIETASDVWLATPSAAARPVVAIGRFPVRTVEQADRVVAKTLAHGRAGSAGRPLIFVSDAPDVNDFDAAAATLAAALPTTLTTRMLSRGVLGAATRERLLAAFAEGPLLVDYIGHASERLWAGGTLSVDDVASLPNAAAPALVIGMTCLTSMFQDPLASPLSEALVVDASGGAYATWASSAPIGPFEQPAMNAAFLDSAVRAGASLGEAANAAAASVVDPDLRGTWVLLGDPSAHLLPYVQASQPAYEPNAPPAAPSTPPAVAGGASPAVGPALRRGGGCSTLGALPAAGTLPSVLAAVSLVALWMRRTRRGGISVVLPRKFSRMIRLDMGNLRYVQGKNVVVRMVADECILLPIAERAADLRVLYVFNDTARWLWERLETGRTAEELAAALTDAFETTAEEARIDVEEFLVDLTADGLIAPLGDEGGAHP